MSWFACYHYRSSRGRHQRQEKTNILVGSVVRWEIRENLNLNITVFLSVKHWNKYFLRIQMGSPRLHERESSLGSQECPSVLCGIRISLFINPAWLAGLARKERGVPKCPIDASARKDFRGPQPRKSLAKRVYCFCFPLAVIPEHRLHLQGSNKWKELQSVYSFIFDTVFQHNSCQWNRNRCNPIAYLLSLIKS